MNIVLILKECNEHQIDVLEKICHKIGLSFYLYDKAYIRVRSRNSNDVSGLFFSHNGRMPDYSTEGIVNRVKAFYTDTVIVSYNQFLIELVPYLKQQEENANKSKYTKRNHEGFTNWV